MDKEGGGVQRLGQCRHSSATIMTFGKVMDCLLCNKNKRKNRNWGISSSITANAAFLVVTACCNTFHWLSLLKLKLDYFSTQGLNNIIHIDFDYKKEFIYWVDSTRPSGRKINRMRLNGSDLKVSPHSDAVSDGSFCHAHKTKPTFRMSKWSTASFRRKHFVQSDSMLTKWKKKMLLILRWRSHAKGQCWV